MPVFRAVENFGIGSCLLHLGPIPNGLLWQMNKFAACRLVDLTAAQEIFQFALGVFALWFPSLRRSPPHHQKAVVVDRLLAEAHQEVMVRAAQEQK